MPKKRMNFTLDQPVAEFLQNHDNASALLNKLVMEYIEGGSAENVIIDYRLEELSGRIGEKQSSLESLEQRYEELKERKQRMREVEEMKLEDAREGLSKIPEDRLGPDNPAVQKRAEELDMSPSELLEELDL